MKKPYHKQDRLANTTIKVQALPQALPLLPPLWSIMLHPLLPGLRARAPGLVAAGLPALTGFGGLGFPPPRVGGLAWVSWMFPCDPPLSG